jgi:two-component system, NarL family, nitrate/nitrite response regulator NarL
VDHPRSDLAALATLTPRERQLVALITQSLPDKQVARQLGITEGTVKIHLHHIYEKLVVRTRTTLTRLMHRLKHLAL